MPLSFRISDTFIGFMSDAWKSGKIVFTVSVQETRNSKNEFNL